MTKCILFFIVGYCLAFVQMNLEIEKNGQAELFDKVLIDAVETME